MLLLAVKLLLAPSFVVGASLAARRFGPRVGGLIAGLPVVAGPILLVYALAHGRVFAAGAAAGTLLGLVSLIAFVVVYARLAGRLFWGASMLAGWLAFAAATAVFSALSLPLGVAVALAAVALALGLACAAATGRRPAPAGHAAHLGSARARGVRARAGAGPDRRGGLARPKLSGLLAPFPVIATVLATFTHAQRGTDELLRLLRGMLSGFGAFALFCFTLAVSLHGSTLRPRSRWRRGWRCSPRRCVLVLVRREPAARPA